MKCKRINITKPKICAGDMRHPITMWDRDQKAPPSATTESTEEYSNSLAMFSGIITKSGTEIFDSSNQLIGVITHEFYIYPPGRTVSTASTRIEFNGKYYKPLRNQDINEFGAVIKIGCAEVGITSLASNG